MVQHHRIDGARDQQIGVHERVELDKGRDRILVGVFQEHNIAGLRIGDLLRRDRTTVGHRGQLGARDRPPGGVDNVDRGQSADLRLGLEDVDDALLIGLQERPRALEVESHCENVCADDLLVLLDIGIGDADRIGERCLHALGEPRFNAQVERDRREDRHQDRGDHGDRREHPDQAHMHARPGGAHLPFGPEARQAPGDEHAKREHERKVDHKENDQR